MKVSIQAACRIALPLYTREVYHTFRSKTTGEQPELSIKVISSITFFDSSVPHLHPFELFQLTVQPEQIFFQLGGGTLLQSRTGNTAPATAFPASRRANTGSNRASSRSTVSSSAMHTCAQRTSVASRAGTSYRAR